MLPSSSKSTDSSISIESMLTDRNNPSNREAVVRLCERYVCFLARKFSNVRFYQDLKQVGYMAVLLAFDNYKENLNIPFSTYAFSCIKNNMLRIMSRENIFGSGGYSNTLKAIKNARKQLPTERGNDLDAIQEIVSETIPSIKKSTIVRVLDEEHPFRQKYENLLSDRFKIENLIGALDAKEFFDSLEFTYLTELQKKCLMLYYGEDKTSSEIAAELGCSPSNVASIVKQAIKNLIKEVTKRRNKEVIVELDTSKHVTILDVSRVVGKSKRTVARWIADGSVDATKDKFGTWYICLKSLEKRITMEQMKALLKLKHSQSI